VGAAARTQLLLDTIHVPKNPNLKDLFAIAGEKGGTSPSDFPTSWLHFKETPAVQPLERHARRSASFGLYQVFNDAGVLGQGSMNRAHVVDEPIWTVSLRAQ
jgi:hypothetical protein